MEFKRIVKFKFVFLGVIAGSRWNLSFWNLSNVNFVAGYVMNFVLFQL